MAITSSPSSSRACITTYSAWVPPAVISNSSMPTVRPKSSLYILMVSCRSSGSPKNSV